MKRRKMFVLKLKHSVYRKQGTLVKVLFLVTVLAVIGGWFLADSTGMALRPPVVTRDLSHLRRSRSLKNYLDNIQVLVEPSTTKCDQTETVALLVLVISSPLRFKHREAIRNTWAKHIPTYFIMGLNGATVKDLLADNYVEAKMYSDLIVFNFLDHYQNLTLKTALMMKWMVDRCPHAQFLFKTDDDVLVNPWTMKKVLEENKGATLIGYRKDNTHLHRDVYNKWYLPRWLHYEDRIPQYLSGTGYLINGKLVKNILEAASLVPLVNLEDVYVTYLVAKRKLGLKLTHDSRLSPYKPRLPLTCLYWGLASAHSLEPDEMLRVWPGLLASGEGHEQREGQRWQNLCATYLTSGVLLF